MPLASTEPAMPSSRLEEQGSGQAERSRLNLLSHLLRGWAEINSYRAIRLEGGAVRPISRGGTLRELRPGFQVGKPVKSRWLVRSLVILTALLCIIYVGQVWLAKRVAKGMYQDACTWQASGQNCPEIPDVLDEWRSTPWSGKSPMITMHWYSYAAFPMPRRTFYDFLCLYTGLDFGNDPSAWEAWFKTHPNPMWDDKRKKLVPGKP